MTRLKGPQPKSSGRISVEAGLGQASPDKGYPSFSLFYVDPKYCISVCDKDDKAAFAERLRILSRLTWDSLHMAGKNGVGCEKIGRSAIKSHPPSHVTEEVPLLAFRFSGKKPMIGYRQGDTFYILWFDRDLNLYNHGR